MSYQFNFFKRLFSKKCNHQYTPWKIQRRILKGPFGITEDDVLRRRCQFPNCSHIQQKEIEKIK